jgi:hypothetical protein
MLVLTSICRSFWIETHVLFGTCLQGIHFSGSQGSRRRVSATFQCRYWCGEPTPRGLLGRRRHESLLGPNLLDNTTLGKGMKKRATKKGNTKIFEKIRNADIIQQVYPKSKSKTRFFAAACLQQCRIGICGSSKRIQYRHERRVLVVIQHKTRNKYCK